MGVIALIPARSGSKRIPQKNIKILGGHPLIAYAIQSALDSEIFDGIYVSSDSDRIGEIAEYYGAKFIKRPEEYARDDSPDDQWISHIFTQIGSCQKYAIIRVTNPFRIGKTIKRAFNEWAGNFFVKAVDPIKQHPFKAWKSLWQYNQYIAPIASMIYCPYGSDKHLDPTNTFPQFFYQNGSIELRPYFQREIVYQPFFTKGYEGFDLNTPEDWILAEALIEKGYAKLPEIKRKPYDFTTV